MLETKIAENTAALAALAAAVADLTAAIRGGNLSEIPTDSPAIRGGNLLTISTSSPAAPASMPPVNPVPAAAAPVASAPASMPPVNPVPAASAPIAPAPASMPPVNPVPAASAPAPAAPVALSGDDLRKLCVKAGAAGLTAEVVQFLGDHGVTKLAALSPADYPALVALLKAKGVE